MLSECYIMTETEGVFLVAKQLSRNFLVYRIERWFLTGELSMSCARPAADGDHLRG